MPFGVGAPPPDPRVAPPPRSAAGAGWSFVEYDQRPSQWGRAEFEPEDMLEGRQVMKASAAKKHADAMQELLNGMRRYENTRFVVAPPIYIRVISRGPPAIRVFPSLHPSLSESPSESSTSESSRPGYPSLP